MRQENILFDSSSLAKHTQTPFILLWFLLCVSALLSFILVDRISHSHRLCCRLHLHVVLYATVTTNIVYERFSGKLGLILFFVFLVLTLFITVPSVIYELLQGWYIFIETNNLKIPKFCRWNFGTIVSFGHGCHYKYTILYNTIKIGLPNSWICMVFRIRELYCKV